MKVVDIGVFEAKTRLSELIERVGHGQVFRITRRGRPVAELRPIAATVSQLHFGVDHGRVQVGDDFDAPLPEFAKYEA